MPDLRSLVADALAVHVRGQDGVLGSIRWFCACGGWSQPFAEGSARDEFNRHRVDAILAALDGHRADVLKTTARTLLAEAEAYGQKWCQPRRGESDLWDRGYVAGMKRAAHDVANSIDRPVAGGETR